MTKNDKNQKKEKKNSALKKSLNTSGPTKIVLLESSRSTIFWVRRQRKEKKKKGMAAFDDIDFGEGHLVVLAHGLGGSPTDLAMIGKCLKDRFLKITLLPGGSYEGFFIVCFPFCSFFHLFPLV